MGDKIEILSPVKTVRKSAIIADKIKSLILDKTYASGEKLPSESELGRMLSVSRASVREALRALELMGLIDVRSGSGTSVKNTDILNFSKYYDPGLATLLISEASTIVEIMEARRIFETNIVIKLAVENSVPEDLNGMAEIVSEMEACCDNEEGFKNADFKFHNEMARLTKNRVIEALAKLLYQMVGEWFPRTYNIICNNPKIAKRTLNAHQKIIEGLKAHDKTRAKAYMSRHWRVAYANSRYYLDYIMKTEGTASDRHHESAGIKESIKELESLKFLSDRNDLIG